MRFFHRQKLSADLFLNLEAFLTDADVSFAMSKGQAQATLQVATSKPIRAWLTDAAGNDKGGLKVEALRGAAVVSPVLGSRRASVTTRPVRGGRKVRRRHPYLENLCAHFIPRQGSERAQKSLALGSLSAAIEISTPDCMPVGGNTHARRTCENGAQDGYFSNAVPGGVKVKLQLDIAHPRIEVRNGKLVIALVRII